jgi:DNA polymerase III delta subunit
MKTLKFNEDEIDLLVALYEDELKEAGSYIDKLKQTLNKLKKEVVPSEVEPVKTGKKRGRKPKIQSEVLMPIVEKKKRGRKPKIKFEEPKLIFGKKRGRKPKILQEYSPLVTMVETNGSSRKRKARKSKKHAGSKFKAEKLPKVEMPVAEEIKPSDL